MRLTMMRPAAGATAFGGSSDSNSPRRHRQRARPAADRHGDPLPAGSLARLGTTRWRHGAEITFVAFGPDGRTLITAGQDRTARVWDLATGREVRRFGRPQLAPLAARNAELEF